MLNLFLAPITGALSDAYGRIPFMAQGRLAIMALFIGHRYCTNVRDWVIIDILGWGIFSAGSWPVMDARWSDVFGRTPELSGRLQAKIWTIATACQIISPLIGAQIFLRNQLAGFWCSAGSLLLQVRRTHSLVSLAASASVSVPLSLCLCSLRLSLPLGASPRV